MYVKSLLQCLAPSKHSVMSVIVIIQVVATLCQVLREVFYTQSRSLLKAAP